MKRLKLLVSLCVWIWVPDVCHSQQEFAGPFRVLVNQVEQCEDAGTGQVYFTSTKIRKVSRNKYVYSTNVTSEVPMNDDLTADADLAVFGNGGWRPHYMQVDLPELCSSMKKLIPSYYNAIKDVAHADCPIPAGTYELKDIALENLKVGGIMPSLPYGKYRTDFTLLLNGTRIGCIRLYSNVIPAKRTRKTPGK